MSWSSDSIKRPLACVLQPIVFIKPISGRYRSRQIYNFWFRDKSGRDSDAVKQKNRREYQRFL